MNGLPPSPVPELLALAFIGPLVVSGLLTAVVIRLAPRLGLIDQPSARKFHTTPTPRGGGSAIVVAMTATAVLCVVLEPTLAGRPHFLFFLWLVLLALPVAVLGLADDLRPLPWQARLFAQAVTAAGAVTALVPEATGWLWLLALLWIVGLTNAFNMLDNMDALSGGVAFLTAPALAASLLLGQSGPERSLEALVPWLALMGGLGGFLWFNRPPARIFLGDVGSMFLGFVIALGTLRVGLNQAGPPWSWAVPLCLCATPCYDLVSVVLLRLSQGRSPFHPDKQHLSHRLVGRGLSSSRAVGVIYLYTLASGASGLLLYAVGSWIGAALVLGQLALWWGALAIVEFATVRG